MARSQSSSFGSFLAGVIVGGLLGAAAALLWAPQSGQSTRRLLKDQAKEVTDSLVSIVEEAGDLFEKASSSLPSFGDKEAKMRKRIEELRSELEQMSSSPQKV